MKSTIKTFVHRLSAFRASHSCRLVEKDVPEFRECLKRLLAELKVGSVDAVEGRERLVQCLVGVHENRTEKSAQVQERIAELLQRCRAWDLGEETSAKEDEGMDVALGFFPKMKLLCDDSEDAPRTSVAPVKLQEKQNGKRPKREPTTDATKLGLVVEMLDRIFSVTLSTEQTSKHRWERVAQELRARRVGQTLRRSAVTLCEMRERLNEGEEDLSMDDVIREMRSEFRIACEKLSQSEVSEADAQEFLDGLVECVEEIYEGRQKLQKTTASPEQSELPSSILANQQPYLHREWRRIPFEKREYDRIENYQCEEDTEKQLSKLRSSVPDGCSDDFFENNPSLSREELLEKERLLVDAVRNRNVLELGADVAEIATWGMDCYTRQNIYDAALDAALSDVDPAAVDVWFQHVLSPTINQQTDRGWCLASTLDLICRQTQPSSRHHQIAATVKARLQWVGEDYFRIHPKGTGVVCLRTSGIPAFTLVEEYLGVLHSPWRWFEIQDILKRQSPNDVPDFYNILLERPRHDPAGYEVTFVDAAAKGTFASRMSHSCDPNCQVAVLCVSGRLTIAMYTTRRVEHGQELTFDYASVTESEKEYRSAICLCASPLCRGSFLHYAGSGAYMQIMSCRHNFLHRNAILLRTAMEPLTQADRDRLHGHGLREACLGKAEDRVPVWLEKWAALILDYIEMEYQLLPGALQESNCQTTPDQAHADAKGVRENRLQNLVITIDKVRMCLQQKCQPKGPPLVLLSEEQILQHLWTGEHSIARRFFRAFVRASVSRENKKPDPLSLSEMQKIGRRLEKAHPKIAQICSLLTENVEDVATARTKLLDVEQVLRELDKTSGGLHKAAADILFLYANTQIFFQPGCHYKGFSSAPLKLQLSSVSGAHSKRHSSSDSFTLEPSNAEPLIFKKYGAHFIWGQLVMWYKQTVNDPTASLSAERRGSLSLPDIESCYLRHHGSYTSKDRRALLEQLTHRPDAMWRVGTIFTFRNESKTYGSPMLDAVLSTRTDSMLLKRLDSFF